MKSLPFLTGGTYEHGTKELSASHQDWEIFVSRSPVQIPYGYQRAIGYYHFHQLWLPPVDDPTGSQTSVN